MHAISLVRIRKKNKVGDNATWAPSPNWNYLKRTAPREATASQHYEELIEGTPDTSLNITSIMYQGVQRRTQLDSYPADKRESLASQ